MRVADWLRMAQDDARRRGLDAVVPLLEGLGASLQVLRDADRSADAPVDALPSGRAEAPRPQPTQGLPAGPTEGLRAIVARLSSGALKAERLVEECLAAIAARQPQLNAFITVTGDEALAAARAADADMAAGRSHGPLHGIPISLKDLIDQAGMPTTAASRVRSGHRAAADAPIVARLREAGSVFIGKTNLHEFAFGTTSDDSAFGAARHPVDPRRSPGGSSGGSAISVATGMALASVGTDTGGSIRIPAAACGIVGLKPDLGELSTDGVFPLSRLLDHVGPMTRSVADAWLLYDVMRGAPVTVPTARPAASFRVGVPRGYLFDRLDEEVERVVFASLARLASGGVRQTDVTIRHASETPHIYLPLVLADAAHIHAHTLETQPGDYTPNVRFRLEMGRYVPAEDYVRALRLRARLAHDVDAALADVDVLALPALSIPAPPIGAASVPVKGGTDVVRSAMLRCTQMFNVTGHPAIALPCGMTSDGLPVGLQLVGRRGGTMRLLEVAVAIEALLGQA